MIGFDVCDVPHTFGVLPLENFDTIIFEDTVVFPFVPHAFDDRTQACKMAGNGEDQWGKSANKPDYEVNELGSGPALLTPTIINWGSRGLEKKTLTAGSL